MLLISETTVAAIHAHGLDGLRQRILQHWHQDLRAAGDKAGPEGRARILGEIEAMSLDDRTLTVADLTMLADLMLVDAVNQLRAQTGGGTG